jgi:4-hydroxy-tetrahydrodipicolinate synthase
MHPFKHQLLDQTIAALNPGRFGGINDSSGDLDHCDAVLAAARGIAVFPSSETALEGARARGFAGCISATANLTSAPCQRLWQGERTVAPEIGRLRGEITARPLIPAIKHLVGRLHGDTEWRRVLPPFLPLDARVAASLEGEVPA